MSVPKPVTTLTDDSRGTFRLFTEASAYKVTLDDAGHTLTRTPGAGLGEMPGIPGGLAPVTDLRKDEQKLELLRIEKCVVGERAILWVKMPGGVPVPPGYLSETRRETTFVRAIESVDAGYAQAQEDARAAERSHHNGDVDDVARLVDAGLILEAIAEQTGIPARWCRVLAVESGDTIFTVYAVKAVLPSAAAVADLVTAVVYTGTTADEVLAAREGVPMRPDAAYRLGVLGMLSEAVAAHSGGDGALRTWLKTVDTGVGSGHEVLFTGRWDHWTPGVQAIAQAALDFTNTSDENGAEDQS